jgi:hypothetical protein
MAGQRCFEATEERESALEKEVYSCTHQTASWSDKCEELQMLKFGRLTDLGYVGSMNGIRTSGSITYTTYI